MFVRVFRMSYYTKHTHERASDSYRERSVPASNVLHTYYGSFKSFSIFDVRGDAKENERFEYCRLYLLPNVARTESHGPIKLQSSRTTYFIGWNGLICFLRVVISK